MNDTMDEKKDKLWQYSFRLSREEFFAFRELCWKERKSIAEALRQFMRESVGADKLL